jgi:hypothetical protein
VVGDGHEYVAMAWRLARGHPPSLSPGEFPRVEALLPARVEGYGFQAPALVAADGRQDFYHPWLYSVAAAPFVAVALRLGLPVLPAFTVLNLILLVGASAVAWKRCGPRVTLLVFGGALAWWFDKAHTELLVTALLVPAVLLLESHPGGSLVLQGLAALQNPTLGVFLLASAVWLLWRGRFRERPARAGLGAAGLLAALGPLYYLWRLGDPTPLASTLVPHRPGLAELLAILIDPNLGLVFAWPALGMAVAGAFIAAVRSRQLRTWWFAAALLAGCAATILLAASQPANLNSGGTRALSRYALWLVPLTVPLLTWFDGRSSRARGFLAAMAAGSLITALGDYHPRLPERYVTPTPLAEWLWRAHPRLTDPLPEVFAERTAHFEGPGVVPTATEHCEKALLVGDDSSVGAWPLWCRPQEVPAACRQFGAYCYASASGNATFFSPPPRQPGFAGLRPVAWYWTGVPDDGLVRFLQGLPWRELWFEDPVGPHGMIEQRQGLGRIPGRINRDVNVAWIERPRYPASITLRPEPAHRAVLIDPLRAAVLASIPLDPASPTLVPIPYHAPLLLVVGPASLLPAGGLRVSPDLPPQL